MKYIILPLTRLFVFLFAILIVYPIILVVLTLWGLWDFKWREKYVNFLNSNFDEQYWLETGSDKYYVYKSALDYLLDKKTWVNKEKKQYK